MGNKKRILAWILSLAMVFGLFGGQASVAKAADAALSFASADVSTKKLPSDGGTVKVTLTFDDFSADEGTIYYRLRKDGATVSGKENVTVDVSRTNNTFDIDVPANTGTEEESYQIWISNTSIPDWQLSWNGAETSFKVTAPSSENPDQPETTKVLPDKTHFRARAVDKSGKPVAGVKFDVKNSRSSYGATTVTSDENGIIECEVGQWDYSTSKIVSLAENDSWTCDTTYSYSTSDSLAEIEKINNEDLKNITEELRFVLKANINKKALKAAIDSASIVKNPDDYSAGYDELQTALTEANKVYDNEDATQEEVDAQTEKLTAALDAVVVKSVDKTKLKELIADADEKSYNRYSYVTSTWNEVDKALTEAKAINKNDKAGQTAVDEAAAKLDTAIKGLKWNPALDSVERVSDENVSSKGGEVQIKLIGKAMDELTNLAVRVKDADGNSLRDSDINVKYGEGTEERIATVTLPENTTSTAKTYKVGFNSMGSWAYTGWKEVSFTVAAASGEIPDPTPSSTKCDEKNFRAKVVDEKGNPVEGVNVNLTGREDSSVSYDVKSDKNGMVTYALTGGDFMLNFDVAIDDKNYTSENEHEFETDGTPTKAPTIISVDGKDLAEADEVVFVVKKNGSSSEEEKVLSDASTFRAKIVDEEGNPVEGVKLSVANELNYIFNKSTASNEKGVAEYTINPGMDYDLTFDVTVAENQGWASSQAHKFATDGYKGNTKIISVDGDDIATTGEIVFTVKKAAVEDKVSCDATHFRAKVVDVGGAPVANVAFEVKVTPGSKTHEITSNEKGVIEYAFDIENDSDATITVKLKDNDTWATLDEHKIVTDAMANIYSVDGKTGYTEKYSYILRKKVDKTALGEALEKAKALVESDYTDDSWSAFKLVLDTAQKTYDNSFVNKEDVDDQIQKLEAGIKVLVVKPAKKDELNAEKDKASKLNKGDYTEESWKTVEDALAEIDALEKEENVPQSKIDAAQEKLATAMKDLSVRAADKEKLNAEKDKASKLDKSDYTEESWKAVEDALAEIDALEKEDNVLQSKVDAAQEKLAAAIEGLKKVDKPEPTPTPEVKKVGSVALKTTTYTYNGKVKTPAVVAKNNKKEVISKDNYTVKYASGRKNVGKYSVTVTFKNGYTGKYTKTFQILPKGTKIKSVKAAKKAFTAKWSKQATQTTGYQLQYSTSKSFKKSVKTSTISKNKTVSKTVKKLKAKKTYYVRVRTYKTVKVSGKSVKLYSGWSTVKKVKTK